MRTYKPGRRAGRPRLHAIDLVSRTIRFDPRLWDWFKHHAIEQETTVQALVTGLMVGFRDHHRTKAARR